MRPDDHHVEPFFAGLGHETKRTQGNGGTGQTQAAEPAARPRRDSTLKWKLLAVLGALAALAWLISNQAY